MVVVGTKTAVIGVKANLKVTPLERRRFSLGLFLAWIVFCLVILYGFNHGKYQHYSQAFGRNIFWNFFQPPEQAIRSKNFQINISFPFGDLARLGDCWGHMTYICSICSDQAFAHILPQVLLFQLPTICEAHCWQKSGQTYQGICSFGWEKSAWKNPIPEKMLLCQALETRAVLVVDMASCHIHPSIPAVAQRCGLRMILVPAGLTCLLQPLDADVFRACKLQTAAVVAQQSRLWSAIKSGNMLSRADGGEKTLLEVTTEIQRLILRVGLFQKLFPKNHGKRGLNLFFAGFGIGSTNHQWLEIPWLLGWCFIAWMVFVWSPLSPWMR